MLVNSLGCIGFALFFLSCDTIETQPQGANADVPGEIAQTNFPQVKSFIESVSCRQDKSGCPERGYTYNPNRYIPGPPEKKVLILDSGMEIFGVSKYAARIESYYRVTQYGVESYQPSVILPEFIEKVFSYFSDRRHVPAADIADIGADIKPELKKIFSRYGADRHGIRIFQTLAEYVPEASFVLFDGHNGVFDAFKYELCDHDLSNFATKVSTMTNALEDIVATHNIRYVNLSAGYTRSAIAPIVRRLCGYMPSDHIEQISDILGEFYERLFNFPQLITVQAADPRSSCQPYDETSDRFPRRIRAGYAAVCESNLDETGYSARNPLRLLTKDMRLVERCTDLYVNFGIKPRRPFPYNDTPYMDFNYFGFGSDPVSSTMTSWAAPLALAYIMSRDLTQPIDMEKLKNTITPKKCPRQIDGRCRVQDPLKHRLL